MTQNKDLSVQQLKSIIEFRKTHEAPVDTVGCGALGQKDDPKQYRFQTLIALMLSSQTKDSETAKAMRNLQKIDGGLHAKTLKNLEKDAVKTMIKSVGFADRKASYIIEAAKICDQKYDGDIPRTLDDLMALKGVGIKMATLAMAHCWNQQDGIGVDVHVHRISNNLGWISTSKPEQTEKELQKVIPEELWPKVNWALVGFGQTICGAKNQKCDECPIADTCRYCNGDDSVSDDMD